MVSIENGFDSGSEETAHEDSYITAARKEPLISGEVGTHPSHGYWNALPGEKPELYEALGVRIFKKVMPQGDYARKIFRGYFTPSGLPKEGTPTERLNKLIGYTKLIERIHLGMFAVFSGLGTYNELESPYSHTETALRWGAIQTFVNIYPIMVQRYNRLRAYQALEHIDNPTANDAYTNMKHPLILHD